MIRINADAIDEALDHLSQKLGVRAALDDDLALIIAAAIRDIPSETDDEDLIEATKDWLRA